MLRFCRVAWAIVLVGAALAQAPPGTNPAGANSAEMTTHDAPATFSSRVNLVMVPVVVRDSKGNAIGNLSQQDFQLFDKSKIQIISRFAVERTDAPPPVLPRAMDEANPDTQQPPPPVVADRFVAYLFDDVHLKAEDLLRIRLAADKHLTESMGPATRAAIITTSGMGILDFTDDQAKLHAAVNAIKPYTPLESAFECPNVSFYMGDAIINKNDSMALQVATSDAAACGNSDNAAFIAHAAALSALTRGEAESKRNLDVLKSLVQRVSSMPGSRSIMLVSPGFFVPAEDMRSAETDVLDKAIRGNIVINSLDARGVYVFNGLGDASQRGINTQYQGIRSTYDKQEALANEDILAELADGTGGRFFRHDNGLLEGLNQLAARPDYIYVLGFSPQNLRYDGEYHRLKISLVNRKGLDVQARRGYYAPKHAADPAEDAKEEIREAVFSRDELPDIPVDVKTQFFKSSDTSARLTVVAHVDMKNIRFAKADDRNTNNLTVVAGIFDRNGNFVSGFQRLIEMKLRDQTLATVQSGGITVRNNFEVTPGIYTIRVVVRDTEGQTMAARNGSVQIP